MPVVVAVAAAIWSAVSAAAVAVAGVVASVVVGLAQTILGATIATTLSLSLSTIVPIYGTIVASIGTIATIATVAYNVYSVIAAFSAGDTATAVGGIIGGVGAIYSIAGGTLGTFVGKLVGGFKQFTQSINLELALRINEIAYLVSDEYRASMNKVYVQIGRVSRSLGNSGEFMQLLIRDAKYMIQDTAAVMGRSYDLGELVWLKTLDDFFTTFSAHAKKYEHRPGELIQDIDKWLFKPAVDVKANVYQNLYGIIDTVLGTSDLIIGEVEEIRGKFDEYVKMLPEEVKAEFMPVVDQIYSKYDYWIDDIYKPVVTALRESNEKHDGDILKMASEIAHIVLYIQNPADYIARVRTLSAIDRERVVSVIAELVMGSYGRDTEKWRTQTDPFAKRLSRIAQLIQQKYPPPTWAVEEIETPQRPAGTPVEPRKTWFVGDY